MTHRNAYINVVGTLLHFHMNAHDRYLWTLPMFHCNGWTFLWTVTAVGGAHICLRKVEPQAVFEKVAVESVTAMCAAPSVLIMLANAPEDLRRGAGPGVRVMTAGAPPGSGHDRKDRRGMGVGDYAHLRPDGDLTLYHDLRAASRGRSSAARGRVIIKARQGVESITSGDLRVFDVDGREVPHDGATLGEIVVRGNAVMKGYYQDPEATAAAIRDGWFHTGDAAVLHPDGYVEIRDRFKDVIISGGENISSIEVEGALLRHPAVQEAAVVGLADKRWGEAPHAFIVIKVGASATAEDLREFARSRLAHFKVPREFHFLAELPKTATGKIQKFVLRGGRAAISKQ